MLNSSFKNRYQWPPSPTLQHFRSDQIWLEGLLIHSKCEGMAVLILSLNPKCNRSRVCCAPIVPLLKGPPSVPYFVAKSFTHSDVAHSAVNDKKISGVISILQWVLRSYNFRYLFQSLAFWESLLLCKWQMLWRVQIFTSYMSYGVKIKSKKIKHKKTYPSFIIRNCSIDTITATHT